MILFDEKESKTFSELNEGDLIYVVKGKGIEVRKVFDVLNDGVIVSFKIEDDSKCNVKSDASMSIGTFESIFTTYDCANDYIISLYEKSLANMESRMSDIQNKLENLKERMKNAKG